MGTIIKVKFIKDSVFIQGSTYTGISLLYKITVCLIQYQFGSFEKFESFTSYSVEWFTSYIVEWFTKTDPIINLFNLCTYHFKFIKHKELWHIFLHCHVSDMWG